MLLPPVAPERARTILGAFGTAHVLVVGDAMQPLKTVHPEATLRRALAIFMQTGYAQLPVVSPLEPDRVLGFLSQQDLIRAYNAEILRRRMGPQVSKEIKAVRPDSQV